MSRQRFAEWVMRLAILVYAVAVAAFIILVVQAWGKPHDPCAPCLTPPLAYVAMFGLYGSIFIGAIAFMVAPNSPHRRPPNDPA